VRVLQVLDSPTHGTGCTLPDDIPGQVNSSGPHSFSFFSARQAAASAADTQSANHSTWTNDNAATSGLQLPQQVSHANSARSSPSSHSSQSTVQLPAVPSCLTPQQGGASNGGPARWGLDMRGTEHKSKAMQAAGRAGKGPVNEVVCGAMMLAYERAGKWEQVSHFTVLLLVACAATSGHDALPKSRCKRAFLAIVAKIRVKSCPGSFRANTDVGMLTLQQYPIIHGVTHDCMYLYPQGVWHRMSA